MPMSPRLLRPVTSGFHPEAQVWRNAVIANGGTVSAGTVKAVSDFCKSIDRAGIRDRFYRLNLFAGTGLNAALVPLYRGQGRTGTQFGNTTDTNNGPFVSGDYTETGSAGGFTPGSANSSKYLDTGLLSTDVGATGHASFYANETTSASGDQSYLRLADNSHVFGMDNFGGVRGFWGALTNTLAGSHNTGHYLVQRTSSTLLAGYRNGSQSNTNGANTTSTPQSRAWYVFASNDVGTAARFVRTRMQGYSIGLSFAAGADITAFYNAIHAFNTALGRNA